MNLIWGIILVSVTLKCWIGQIIIAFSPKVAVKIRIIENESDVNQTFFSEKRGKAIWDAISLWTLPFTGILRNGIHFRITKKLKLKYMILILWGLMAIITIMMALVTLIW